MVGTQVSEVGTGTLSSQFNSNTKFKCDKSDQKLIRFIYLDLNVDGVRNALPYTAMLRSIYLWQTLTFLYRLTWVCQSCFVEIRVHNCKHRQLLFWISKFVFPMKNHRKRYLVPLLPGIQFRWVNAPIKTTKTNYQNDNQPVCALSD